MPAAPDQLAKAYRERIRELQRFQSLIAKRHRQDPADAMVRGWLFFTYSRLGMDRAALAQLGRSPRTNWPLAVQDLRQTVRISKVLVRLDPDRESFTSLLTGAYYSLYRVQAVRGNKKVAHQALVERSRLALVFARRRAALDRGNLEWQDDLASQHQALCNALRNQERTAEAARNLRTAIAVRQGLVKARPKDPAWRNRLADCHHVLSDLRSRQGDRAGARSVFEQLRPVRARLAVLTLRGVARPANLPPSKTGQAMLGLDAPGNIRRARSLLALTEYMYFLESQYFLPASRDRALEVGRRCLELAETLDRNQDGPEIRRLQERGLGIYRRLAGEIKLVQEEYGLIRALESALKNWPGGRGQPPAKAGRFQEHAACKGQRGKVVGLAFSPDGKTLAAGTG
jgi:hypothetical protein